MSINFFGIGAQKSGTTWLFYQLNQISEFELPPVKELHYFDRSTDYPSPNKLNETYFYKRALNLRYLSRAVLETLYYAFHFQWGKVKFFLKWYFSNYSDEWFLSLFKNYSQLTGEVTPSYAILNEDDIRRMYNIAPQAKLILMLRNPIDRAWSHYRHNIRHIKDFSLKDVDTQNIIKFLKTDEQLLRSDYTRTINNYKKVFPKHQILIGFYDAIKDNPNKLLNDIVSFIAEDTQININISTLDNKINKSREIDCPKEITSYLKDYYHDEIKFWAEEYGGYFEKWYLDSYSTESSNKEINLMPTIQL